MLVISKNNTNLVNLRYGLEEPRALYKWDFIVSQQIAKNILEKTDVLWDLEHAVLTNEPNATANLLATSICIATSDMYNYIEVSASQLISH